MRHNKRSVTDETETATMTSDFKETHIIQDYNQDRGNFDMTFNKQSVNFKMTRGTDRALENYFSGGMKDSKAVAGCAKRDNGSFFLVLMQDASSKSRVILDGIIACSTVVKERPSEKSRQKEDHTANYFTINTVLGILLATKLPSSSLSLSLESKHTYVCSKVVVDLHNGDSIPYRIGFVSPCILGSNFCTFIFSS